MKRLSAKWFNSIVNTLRPAPTVDSGGGIVQNYTANLTGVAVRIDPVQGSRIIGSSTINPLTTHLVYASPDTDILVGDRIIFGSSALDIQSAINPDYMNVFLKFEAKEAA